VSEIALEYYKSLAQKRRGPDGNPLSPAELRVLNRLCYRHHQGVWCAFEELDEIATAVHLSKGHCRRVMAGLERRKMVRRYAVVNARSGASTSNECELPDLLRWLVGEGRLRPNQVRPLLRRKRGLEARMEFFREVRVRTHAVVRGVRGVSAEPTGGQGVLKMSAEPLGGQGVVRVSAEAANRTLELPFFAVERVAPPTQDDRPPHAKCSPSSSKREIQEWKSSSPFPPRGVAGCGDRKGKGKERCDGGGRTGDSGVPGAVVAGTREAKRLGERAELDGIDAALYDEAEAVLGFAGIAPANATRRQREAVRRALELYCSQHEVAPAAAGETACAMWDFFNVASSYMLQAARPDLRRFFAEGYWLNAKRWPWMIHELRRAPMVRQGDGSVMLSFGEGWTVDSRRVM